MPDKIIYTLDMFFTVFSVTLFIAWSSIITVIPSVLAFMYWFQKIKYSAVNRHHGGSWWKWFKSFFKK